jgi:putative serine protease PepD
VSAQDPPPSRRDLVEGWYRLDDPTLTGPAPDGDPPTPAGPPVYDPTRAGSSPLGGGPPVRPTDLGPPTSPPSSGPTSQAGVESGRTRRGFGLGALAMAAFIGALVAAVVGAGAVLFFDDNGSSNRGSLPADSGEPLRLDGDALDIQAVLQKVQPSVVSISTEQTRFGTFGGGAGSGIIIDGTGLILTNAHVVAGAESMEVSFFDGTLSPAVLVGSSPDDDLALIRATDAADLTPAALGSSASVRVGDEVVAIGNALNLGSQPTVTLGIVSAKDRIIEDSTLALSNLLQTDAAINPGNSGGPLVNALGEVVGVNTAIINDAQNIGFAISIDTVKPLIEQIEAGDVDVTPGQAFLGVSQISVADLSDALREEFGVSAEEGAFIAAVDPDSGADQVGLEAGDVVIAIDGETVASSEDLARIIRDHDVGDEVSIDYLRGDENLSGTGELVCNTEPC